MASTSMSPLLSALVLILIAATSAAASPSMGFRTYMKHVDSTGIASGNYSKLQLLERSMARSAQREVWMQHLQVQATSSSGSSSSSPSVSIPVHPGQGEFLMDLAIGTPALPFSAIVDTGSDLVWTQCQPCQDCFQQPTPIFDPSTSTTFSDVPCEDRFCRALPESSCAAKAGTSGVADQSETCQYTYTYGDSSTTEGVLGSETFTFISGGDGGDANVSIPSVAFGCGESNSGGGFGQGAGLVGMGRGPLSLVSQLNLDRFAYCLTSYGKNDTSPLLFGSLASVNGSATTGAAQTTAFASNPPSIPTFFYLSLKSISVGSTIIPVPSPTSIGGGFIIDSGTTVTTLDMSLYEPVKEAFLKQMQLPVAETNQQGNDLNFDLCWKLPPGSSTSNISVPSLAFHFDGADLDLPAENYIAGDGEEGAVEDQQICLVMAGGSGGLSIFGNFQQQGYLVMYDLSNDQLSFAPAQCDKL